MSYSGATILVFRRGVSPPCYLSPSQRGKVTEDGERVAPETKAEAAAGVALRRSCSSRRFPTSPRWPGLGKWALLELRLEI